MQESSQSQDKYQRFLTWFTKNGGKYSDIVYPTLFPPTDYIGISAKNHIPRYKVIMSIPKNLIIGIQRIRQSEIGFLFNQYPCFEGQNNDDIDFNILTIFLIFEKMKGANSFFFPYFQCITIAETMIHWTNQQINALGDPFLNLSFINEVKSQFEPTFRIFKQIQLKNKHLFPLQLTQKLFYQCYGITMTRCFGWGLPQTMLVPLADFLNHSADGVHHYAFSATLQSKNHPKYIKKARQLDLTTVDIDNKKQLPIGYEKDRRQLYIFKNSDILPRQLSNMHTQNRSNTSFKEKLNKIRQFKIKESYQNDIVPSSQSQDNDSQSESEDESDYQSFGVEAIRYCRTKRFFRQLYSVVLKSKQEVYDPPKPLINRQFQDGVDFSWWKQVEDSSFIVATSSDIDKGQQIFNSYGRRSNRFLLLWYGFTYEKNKYDSVPFRIWAEKVEANTGQLTFTRYITDVDWKQQIPLGNQRYPYTYLTNQFRLKKTQINYCLLAYLRYRVIRNDQKFDIFKKRYSELSKILNLELELQVLKIYKKILIELIQRYGIQQNRDFSGIQGHRGAFAKILINSNTEIICKHCQLVQFLQTVLKRLMNSSIQVEYLQLIYKQKWYIQQLNNISEQISNRIFLRNYFRLLKEYMMNNIK